jgi:beta-N-acetylglucosaminidase
LRKPCSSREIKQGVRRRASSYTSAAAARGLAADDRRRLSKEEKVDYESLEKVEAFQLSADEINRFMEGNK